jgi:hypothetical protein
MTEAFVRSSLPPSGVPLSRAYIGTNNYETAVAVGQDGTVFLSSGSLGLCARVRPRRILVTVPTTPCHLCFNRGPGALPYE